MEKSIKNRITAVMECEQLSRFSAQEESQYVPVHRMTGTDSTNFHGSLWNRAQTATCLESTAEIWATDRFFPSKTRCQGADFATFTIHEYRQCLQCCQLSPNPKLTACPCALTCCPLLPAGGGRWQSPFPGESWCPAVWCTRCSEPPCQTGVASTEPLTWQLLPVFDLVDKHNVLQFHPACLLKPSSTVGEKNRDVLLFKRIHFVLKITFWLKNVSVSIFFSIAIYLTQALFQVLFIIYHVQLGL